MSATTSAGGASKSENVGVYVAVAALIAVVAAFTVAAFAMEDAREVTEALGPVLTLIGTLAGGFLGIKVGAQGKDEVDKKLIQSTSLVEEMAGKRAADVKEMSDRAGREREALMNTMTAQSDLFLKERARMGELSASIASLAVAVDRFVTASGQTGPSGPTNATTARVQFDPNQLVELLTEVARIVREIKPDPPNDAP